MRLVDNYPVLGFLLTLGKVLGKLMCEMECLNQRSPTFLAPGTGFVEDNFPRMGVWVGEMPQAVMRAMGSADEASLACPSLTSGCAACFLTGCGPVPVCGPGVGDP